MTIEAEVAALTVATTDLLTAVNVGKTELDSAVSAAEGSAANASDSAAAAASSAATAAGYVVPPLSGNAGKLLAVNGLATATEWVPPPESGGLEVADWAALLALTSIPDGRVYTVMAPLITGGAPGTMWKRDSASLSGWRPAGRQVIYMSRTEVVGITTTNEQIQRTLEIPGGVLTGCLMIVPTARTSWSSADGATRTSRWRLGALGTIADAQIGVSQTVTASHRQSQHSQAYVADSATLLSQWQIVNIQNTSWVGQVSSANPLTFDSYTVDTMASTIYLSATQQQSGTPGPGGPTLEFFALEIA